MQFKQYKQGDLIFRYKDYGNLFYMIVKGEVGIKIPTSEEMKLTKH